MPHFSLAEIIIPLGFFSAIICLVIGIPFARVWAKAIERKQLGKLGTPAANGDVIARLERIEQAIDVMATEVERITEGQRFVTKLLSDTRPNAAIPAPLSSPGGETVFTPTARHL